MTTEPVISPSPDGLEKKEHGRGAKERIQPPPGESIQPFRLAKYFSLSGFVVIMAFTLALTIFISHQAKLLVQKKNLDYVHLLATNVNHQVFLQWSVPMAAKYKEIRLRDPAQYKVLDAVVRNAIHGFNVDRVNLYTVEGIIAYSTDRHLIGTRVTDVKPYEQALKGEHTSILFTQPGKNPFSLDQAWTLQTFFPFRGERWTLGPVGNILGVFEIYQNLTEGYRSIAKFQYLSMAISIGVAGILFIILRQILVRGETIIEARNKERRRLEEKLHHSQRLAHLGQMIAAVAHEIRNPLGIISSTAELLQGRLQQSEPNHRLAGVIVEESRRLNGIVTEFLDFARPQIPRTEICRIEDILEKNLNFLTPTFDQEGIEVIRDYSGPEFIEADQDLIYRAFLNVFMNAIQAMPQGGQIKVSTANVSGPNSGLPEQVEVVIADTGVGVDPTQVENLFSPFFTTRNRGSGLGLAIVKNIVEGHQGSVAIEPGAEGGTRMIVRLPIKHDHSTA